MFHPNLLIERYPLKFQDNILRKLFVPNLREVITFEVCIRDISSDVTLVLDVYGCLGKYQENSFFWIVYCQIFS